MAKYLDNLGLTYLLGKIKTLFVPQTRTINNKSLESDISLTAADVGAATLDDIAVTPVTNMDSANKIALRSLESGTYKLTGYFTAYEGSSASYTFSTGMLVAVLKQSSMSYVQIFYPKNNTIQYLEISDSAVVRKDAKFANMEVITSKVTAIDQYSDDEHYPSAKAVYDALPDTSGFLTEETDPTVPSWAKQSTKPSYTAAEVGALPLSGGTMTGDLVAMSDNTGNAKVRNVSFGTSLPDTGTDGDIFILLKVEG